MKVFFFCCTLSVEKMSGFDHQIITLAEGLSELLIPTYGNINYWRLNLDKDFLIYHDEKVNYYDCNVVVLTTKYLVEHENDIPSDLFLKSRNYKLVCIDAHDGLITPSFNICSLVDIVLKCHYNRKFSYPPNYSEWQFGLSNRIINSVSDNISAETRRKSVLINYSLVHSLRRKAHKEINPILDKYFDLDMGLSSFEFDKENINTIDELFFLQTAKRHYPSYYEKLNKSVACLCFGGFLTNKFMDNDSLPIKVLRKLNYDLEWIKNDRVFQWDSWRLWEAMAAGAVMIHIDFEVYGMQLPENPINGEHYIGVDFDNLQDFENQIRDLEKMRRIGINGKDWALSNFSPIRIGQRFIELVDKID